MQEQKVHNVFICERQRVLLISVLPYLLHRPTNNSINLTRCNMECNMSRNISLSKYIGSIGYVKKCAAQLQSSYLAMWAWPWMLSELANVNSKLVCLNVYPKVRQMITITATKCMNQLFCLTLKHYKGTDCRFNMFLNTDAVRHLFIYTLQNYSI